MNKRAIKTYEDLELEEQRLTAHLASLKTTMGEDIAGVKQGLKEKLNPFKKAKEKVANLFTRDGKNGPAINFALNFVLDFVIRIFIPKRTSIWTKTVIPFITKNYVSHLITDEQRSAVAKFVNESVAKVDNMIRKSMIKKQEADYKTPAADPAFATPHTVNTNPMGL
ncbi:MAG TPA: hypothetical protein VGB71_16725 [Flavisolibacter sp.]